MYSASSTYTPNALAWAYPIAPSFAYPNLSNGDTASMSPWISDSGSSAQEEEARFAGLAGIAGGGPVSVVAYHPPAPSMTELARSLEAEGTPSLLGLQSALIAIYDLAASSVADAFAEIARGKFAPPHLIPSLAGVPSEFGTDLFMSDLDSAASGGASSRSAMVEAAVRKLASQEDALPEEMRERFEEEQPRIVEAAEERIDRLAKFGQAMEIEDAASIELEMWIKAQWLIVIDAAYERYVAAYESGKFGTKPEKMKSRAQFGPRKFTTQLRSETSALPFKIGNRDFFRVPSPYSRFRLIERRGFWSGATVMHEGAKATVKTIQGNCLIKLQGINGSHEPKDLSRIELKK